MNNRPRLVFRLIDDDGTVVMTKLGERLFLTQPAGEKLVMLGCMKTTARKTPSFRKGVKYYATKI